jgi:hypothetical protein
MTNVTKRICTHIVCAALCLMVIGSAQADTYLMSRLPDPERGLTKEETDALKAKANAGDWEIKQLFAIAYLHEYLSFFSRDQGCKTLKHGGYCRALAEHPKAGRRFLEEIVEVDGKAPVYQINLAAFQAQYASYWMTAARLDGYDPETPACKKAVRYYERAIENERSVWKGRSCTAERLGNMAWYGLCIPIDKEKAADYWKYSHGCPRP